MRKNVIYDYVIPLGERCACTQCLKHYNLRPRGQKLPFDWLSHGTLESRIWCILDNFDNFFVPDRLQKIEYIEPQQWKNWHFYDTKTKLWFVHNFPKDLPFDAGFICALENFIPKINLMRQIMNSGERILLVYMTQKNIPARIIRQGIKKLRKHFNNPHIDLLIIANGIKTMWKHHKKTIVKGATKYTIKSSLMATFWKDTTLKQFQQLDKIFKKISVSPKSYDNN